MLNKLFVLIGVVAVVLLALNFVLYGSAGIDWRFFILLVFAVIFLLYPVYEPKLSVAMKNFTDRILLLVTVVISLTLIISIFFLLKNLPKTPPFDEELIPPTQVAKVEQEAYVKLDEVLRAHQEKHSESIDYLNQVYQSRFYENNKALELLQAVNEDQEALFNFLAQNTCSLPQPYSWYETETPDYGYFLSAIRAEFLNIAVLFSREEYVLANEKYNRLWDIADHLFSATGTDVYGYTINLVVMDELIVFHMENYQDIENFTDLAFVDAGKAIRGKIDQSYKYLCIADGVGFKNSLQRLDEIALTDFWQPDFLGKFALFFMGEDRLKKWPIFDYYQTIKVIDDYNQLAINLGEKPFYEIEGSLDGLQFFMGVDAESSVVNNPIGASFLVYKPDWVKFIIKKEQVKSRLTAFIYLLDNKDVKEVSEAPIDNLSGEPYQVISEDEIFGVRSAISGGVELKIQR